MKQKIDCLKAWLIEVKGPKKPIERIPQVTAEDLAAKFNKKYKK